MAEYLFDKLKSALAAAEGLYNRLELLVKPSGSCKTRLLTGFLQSWQDGDYGLIVEMAQKLPCVALEEDHNW